MITTRFAITQYLAEYLKGKYNTFDDSPISLPDSSDIYHLLWELMSKRPSDIGVVDSGNVFICLPDRRIGKDPQYYNYISSRAAKIFETKLEALFNAELHQRLDENHSSSTPMCLVDVIHHMLSEYGIDSISEDALKKNYYRGSVPGNVKNALIFVGDSSEKKSLRPNALFCLFLRGNMLECV